MNGNVPTQRDNLISLAYILAYIASKTLPWIGQTDPEIRKQKQNCSLLLSACPVYAELLPMLMDQDESVDVLDVVKNAIAYVREHVSSSRITFGVVVMFFSSLDGCTENEQTNVQSSATRGSTQHDSRVSQTPGTSSCFDGCRTRIRSESCEWEATDRTDKFSSNSKTDSKDSS